MNSYEHLFTMSGLSLDRLRSFLSVVEAGNISRAALGDAAKQSQYSRQIKELEAFFGVALTRRIGRRIEITEEGKRLALMIRRQFAELEDFREAMAGRNVTLRLGSQGSIINWLLMPRLGPITQTLGKVTLELQQMRTLDVVRAVDDGRLDFGIVRENAFEGKRKCWRLGKVGYALFAPASIGKKKATIAEIIRTTPMVELIPGGQFSTQWQQWLHDHALHPNIIARVSSFTDMVTAVKSGYAAVLPELAALEFPQKSVQQHPLPELKGRALVLIAHERSLDRMNLDAKAIQALARLIQIA
jgi:DNA-binding transcriptional LysR family regulator